MCYTPIILNQKPNFIILEGSSVVKGCKLKENLYNHSILWTGFLVLNSKDINIVLDFTKLLMCYKGDIHKYILLDRTEHNQVEMHETLKDNG